MIITKNNCNANDIDDNVVDDDDYSANMQRDI